MNERRYEFGDPDGAPDGWVCAKIPHDGSIKKDCVPKVNGAQSINILLHHKIGKLYDYMTVTDLMNSLHQREAPGWYAHLLDNRDFRVITSSEEAKEYYG